MTPAKENMNPVITRTTPRPSSIKDKSDKMNPKVKMALFLYPLHDQGPYPTPIGKICPFIVVMIRKIIPILDNFIYHKTNSLFYIPIAYL